MSKKNRSEWLKAMRKELGFSQQEMADLLEIGQSTYAHMELGKKSSLNIEHLISLIGKLNVNPYFLLLGQSPMFIGEGNKSLPHTTTPPISLPSSGSSYLVPVAAQAGYAEGWPQDTINLPQVVIPGVKDPNARVFEVEGDSMDPVLMHGDYVACSKVEDPRYIRDSLIYVVVSSSNGITVKYLRRQPTTMRFFSENHAVHQPFDWELEHISEIWEVQMRITRHVSAGRFVSTPIGDSTRVDRLENIVEKLLQLPQFQPKMSG